MSQGIKVYGNDRMKIHGSSSVYRRNFHVFRDKKMQITADRCHVKFPTRSEEQRRRFCEITWINSVTK